MFKPRLIPNDPLHYKSSGLPSITLWLCLCVSHPSQRMPLNILVIKEEFIRLLK